MPNQLQLAGAQGKSTAFAPIYTGRWSSGIWTNRSPLRDANTSRNAEKYYGPNGDALIAGLNVEITNRLTLARRPGCDAYDNNGWDSVLDFEEFSTFEGINDGTPLEQKIYVMVDQEDGLYSLANHIKTLIWEKSAGAGQSYMQSVGNSLYFGNGVDNKKWLHYTYTWSSGADWTKASTPLFSTFLQDANGNIQQLTGQGISSDIIEPTWSTQIPSSVNQFQGGITVDGTAEWTNRGPFVENWGLAGPTETLVPSLGDSDVSWNPNTRYSLPGVIIDSNGNLQQVSTKGISGATVPTWATSVGVHTTDGTAVWVMLQTAASLVWQPHTTYAEGVYVIGNGCLFQASLGNHVTVDEPITAWIWPFVTGDNGRFSRTYPATGESASSSAGNIFTIQSPGNSQPFIWYVTNGAGETTSEPVPFASFPTNYSVAMFGSVNVPVAGQYSISLGHLDGMIFGVGGGATQVSGTLNDPFNHLVTAVNGYTVMMSNNTRFDNPLTDTCVVNFPSAGTYPIEIDYAYANNGSAGAYFSLFFNGQTATPPPVESGSVEPSWPAWSTQYAPAYPTVAEQASHQITWSNLGPISDLVWQANITFTLPNASVLDSNANTEFPYRTGTSGTVQPTWSLGLYQLTPDAPNLTWINEGVIGGAPPAGTLSTYNGGWKYAIALVNTLDDTVSNCGPVTAATGNFVGISGITFAPGSGLPTDLTQIDPQADYVAIFRSTDGESTVFLIPGLTGSGSPVVEKTTTWTLPLVDYLRFGYTDTATDEQLNNLIEGAVGGENTPPGTGAINLTYHLNRIFFSIGNVVYWTAGPDTPVGNGVNGVPPLNFDTLPSKVIRIQPVAIGALVFTVNGIWLIQGSGTTSSPIQGAIPYLPNIGVLNYNAVALDGSIIGLFTTENQFLILDPSAGTVDAGFPIGNMLRLNNGTPGQSWNAANVYVTVHTEGEDHAFYVSDGENGWYRLMPTPSPEVGYTWSPFAAINQGVSSPLFIGCKAVKSIEVTPGQHRLLIGPSGTGPILKRNIDIFTDSGLPYAANAVVGSAVLAQPGQLATVMFVTTESVRTGNPLVLGLLIDEALPYYKGEIEVLKDWISDPVNLPPSTSIIGQRFYLDELREMASVCRHLQIQVLWSPTDSVQNELLTMTVFGGFIPEG